MEYAGRTRNVIYIHIHAITYPTEHSIPRMTLSEVLLLLDTRYFRKYCISYIHTHLLQTMDKVAISLIVNNIVKFCVASLTYRTIDYIS